MKILFFFSLFFFWVFCTFFTIFSFDGGLGIISYQHSKKDLLQFPVMSLTKGNVLVGKFIAYGDNLGIVQIRFAHIPAVSFTDEDLIQFSLKEEAGKTWYSQNIYQGNIISHMPFFPFGFAPMKNSLNKTYIFQIASLRGNKQNALTLSTQAPVFITKYQIDSVTKANKTLLLKFFVKKIVNDLQIPDIIFASIIYMLPVILFMIRFFAPLRMTKWIWITILLGTLFTNIFLFQSPFLPVYISFALIGILGIFWKLFLEKEMLSMSFFFGVLFALFSLAHFHYASLVTGYTAYAFFGSILIYYFFYGVKRQVDIFFKLI